MAKVNIQTKAQATAMTAAAQIATVKLVETFKPSKEFLKAVKAYKKARAKAAEAKAEQDTAAEVIKAELSAAGVDEYADKNGHVIFREVETSRINSKELRERCPLIWAQFTDVTTSRPLKVF